MVNQPERLLKLVKNEEFPSQIKEHLDAEKSRLAEIYKKSLESIDLAIDDEEKGISFLREIVRKDEANEEYTSEEAGILFQSYPMMSTLELKIVADQRERILKSFKKNIKKN